MSRGLNKLAVFKENRERTRMLNLIRENVAKYDVEIYAYCIMPNHFHLLIKADLKELASFMAKVLAEFAKYYNQKHNRVGYVFQNRYKSQCVENIGYFWNCLRYIHNNPSYLKNVDSIVNYKYSSMRELFYGEKDLLPELIFELVAGKFQNMEEFYQFHLKDNWDVFDDVVEEAWDNKIKIARSLLQQYESIYETKAIEIIDYIKTKQIYKNELVQLTHISSREADEIIKILRKESEGTG